MESRWLCCAIPITTWPTRSLGTRLRATAASMAMPPSRVAEKRENSPGSRLSCRMSARGSRRPPSTMTMLGSRMVVTSLRVQEHGGDARPVLDEAPHPQVHVDGALAAGEAAALD